MILIQVLVLNLLVRGDNDQKDNFETVKVNSGIHVGKGFTYSRGDLMILRVADPYRRGTEGFDRGWSLVV